MRILIAEDEADIRDLLRVVMEEEGHQAVFAESYHGAERLLRLWPWDIVVADVGLPDGSGLDLARSAVRLGLPTLICTGDFTEAEALQAQGMDFLQKPFTLGALIGKIAALGPKVVA